MLTHLFADAALGPATCQCEELSDEAIPAGNSCPPVDSSVIATGGQRAAPDQSRIVYFALKVIDRDTASQLLCNPTGVPEQALETFRTAWQAGFPNWVVTHTSPFFAPSTLHGPALPQDEAADRVDRPVAKTYATGI